MDRLGLLDFLPFGAWRWALPSFPDLHACDFADHVYPLQSPEEERRKEIPGPPASCLTSSFKSPLLNAQQSARDESRIKLEKHALELRQQKRAAEAKAAKRQSFLKWEKHRAKSRAAKHQMVYKATKHQARMKWEKVQAEHKMANQQIELKAKKNQARTQRRQPR